MLTEKRIKILKWIGYPLFALICFFFSLLLTFPFDIVKDQISAKVEKEQKIKMTIGSLSASLPFGVQATDVVFDNLDGASSPVFPLPVPYLRVNISPLSALFGTLDVDFEAELFGGAMEGEAAYEESTEIFALKMEIDDFQFAETPSVKKQFKELPVEGSFSLLCDVNLTLKDMKKATGFVEMAINDGVIGPGKWGMEIPKLITGSLDARFVMKKGRLEVETFSQTSPDMMSDMRGSIVLAKNFSHSRANLDYRFKIADHLLQKHDIFKLALSALGRAKGSDSFYYHSLTGPLTRMKPKANKALQYKFQSPSGKKAKPKKSKLKKAKKKKKVAKAKKSRTKIPTAKLKPKSRKRPPKRPRKQKKRSRKQRKADAAKRAAELEEDDEEELEEDDEINEPEEEETSTDEPEDDDADGKSDDTKTDDSQKDDVAEPEEEE